MTRKVHLQNKQTGGVSCQRGHAGASLRGEHITYQFAEFSQYPKDQQCQKCLTGKLFSFLAREAAKQAPADQWEAAEEDWFEADKARIAELKARKAK